MSTFDRVFAVVYLLLGAFGVYSLIRRSRTNYDWPNKKDVNPPVV